MEISVVFREGSVEIWSDGMLEYRNVELPTSVSISLLLQFSRRSQ
jgi:hypothetical protein